MSTGATFSFKINESDFSYRIHQPLTFFASGDGFPSGAARFFYLAHKEDTCNQFADKFFRANSVEFAYSHDSHVDTVYRYHVTIKKNGIFVRAQESHSRGKWTTFFNGEYWEFINKYRADNDANTFMEIPPSLYKIDGVVLSKEFAQKTLQGMKKYLEEHIAMGTKISEIESIKKDISYQESVLKRIEEQEKQPSDKEVA